MPRFDVAIVGAGPAAIGALWGLQSAQGGSRTVAVLTGETGAGDMPRPDSTWVHPKVRKVIFEARMQRVIGQFVPTNSLGKSYYLFETACRGGLTSFWGQQFVRLLKPDFVAAMPGQTFDDYEAAFDLIEGRLGLAQPEAIDGWTLPDGFDLVIRPTTIVEPIDSFVHQFALASAGTTVIRQRLTRLERASQSYRLVFEDGEGIEAGRVILASGVIGTARILMRSVPELRHARFRDHMPVFLHSVSLGNRHCRTARRQSTNMNMASIEVTRAGQLCAFLSIYNVRKMPANLLLAHFGLPMLGALSGRNLEILPLPFYPVQTWTRDSFVEIDLERADEEIVARRCRFQDNPEGLQLARTALKACGLREIRLSPTPAGMGFHYHALQLSEDGVAYDSARSQITRLFGDDVLIVDGSVLPWLSPRPHTETLVANALISTRSMMNG